MLLFLIIKTNFRSQNKSHKRQKISLKVVLKRLSDISVVCSHYCLMIQDNVSCMLVAVELWTKF
jgi:hypothetical protein